MIPQRADVVICGAGIAGIATAYQLAAKEGVPHVVLIDERPPLTLTSDKSTECYRNWWPGPGDTMVRFMNRSIDLLEALAAESDNFFSMNRRGYMFLTADADHAAKMEQRAQRICDLGAGDLRLHNGRSTSSIYTPSPPHGYTQQPTGADLITDKALILQHYPFVTDGVTALLHARRCGWLSAQQLGMYLLDQAKAKGASLITGKVTDVGLENGRVHTVQVQTATGLESIQTRTFVNAAGPYVADVGKMVGVDIPVFNELHAKVAFNDYLKIVPRNVPLTIWEDPVQLPWSDEAYEELAADESTRWLTESFPAGVHFRPEGSEGSDILLILWTYHLEAQTPVWPPTFDPLLPEVVIRGLSRMIPDLAIYFDKMQKPWVDGGYYCKTQENRFLVTPLPVDGAFMVGALSGYGIMSCMAASELISAHITGGTLPSYAPDFHIDRYQDPAYQALLSQWDATTGQL